MVIAAGGLVRTASLLSKGANETVVRRLYRQGDEFGDSGALLSALDRQRSPHLMLNPRRQHIRTVFQSHWGTNWGIASQSVDNIYDYSIA